MKNKQTNLVEEQEGKAEMKSCKENQEGKTMREDYKESRKLENYGKGSKKNLERN